MKVCVINPNYQYLDMFGQRGWDIVESIEEADLVQFTGGEDVTPELYGERPHVQTMFNKARDAEEVSAFVLARELRKPMAGICRGGQFLNVMCGGKLYQHVNNHGLMGTHMMVATRTGEMFPVTSTHHQMMRPGIGAEVIGVASEATVVEYMDNERVRYVEQKRGDDIESVLYPEHGVLCYQPHPEYLTKDSECQEFYFKMIEEIL